MDGCHKMLKMQPVCEGSYFVNWGIRNPCCALRLRCWATLCNGAVSRVSYSSSRMASPHQGTFRGIPAVSPGGGIDPSMYAGHSFSIGAATPAAVRRLHDSLIKTLGRWNSSAYILYVQTPRTTLLSVSKSLVVGMCD